MNEKKILATAFLALAFNAAPAFADWDDWDSNADGLLDENEFQTGFDETDQFSSFDQNDDGVLDGNEFSALADDEDMGFYDDSGDGVLDDDEFTTGVYDRYDADDSGYIEQTEYEEDDELLDIF